MYNTTKYDAILFLVPHRVFITLGYKNFIKYLNKGGLFFDYKYKFNDKQFSYAYLAGYTDAEGCITFELRHQKGWKGIGISSSYRCLYRLTSNNFGHLAYLKNQLEEKGWDM